MKDAEYAAIRRDQLRIGMRRRRNTPIKRQTGPRHARRLPPIKVPAEPLATWLRGSGHTITELEAVLSPRQRLAIVKGEQQNVELDTVDRVLLHVGDGTTIDDLYPRSAMTESEAA